MTDEKKYPTVITIAQQKGGVGKTTIARMLAIYAAREDLLNRPTLAIDLDLQASYSKLSLPMDYSEKLGTQPPLHPEHDPKDTSWNGRSSAAEIFFDGEVVPYPVVFPYPIPNLTVLPADKARLQTVEEQDRTVLRERVLNRLYEFLSLPDVVKSVDMVIIDTGPKDSALLKTALRAATHMIMPIKLETQSIDGLWEMLAMWRTERAARPPERPLDMAGMVCNMFDARYSSHQAYLAQVASDERLAPFLCQQVFPQRAAVTERDARGIVPGALFDTDTDAREIALSLCSEIFGRVFPAEAKRIKKLKPDRKYTVKSADVAKAAKSGKTEKEGA